MNQPRKKRIFSRQPRQRKERERMGIVVTILAVMLVICLFKWLTYYHATRGLLYYLVKKYDDIPSQEQIKELISKSFGRTLKELLEKS